MPGFPGPVGVRFARRRVARPARAPACSRSSSAARTRLACERLPHTGVAYGLCGALATVEPDPCLAALAHAHAPLRARLALFGGYVLRVEGVELGLDKPFVLSPGD
jgi:hypothetical protein